MEFKLILTGLDDSPMTPKSRYLCVDEYMFKKGYGDYQTLVGQNNVKLVTLNEELEARDAWEGSVLETFYGDPEVHVDIIVNHMACKGDLEMGNWRWKYRLRHQSGKGCQRVTRECEISTMTKADTRVAKIG
ncbi:hypothetical protein ACLOJK_032428 [Asimina triloba]